MSVAHLCLDKPEHYIDRVVWEIIWEIPEGSHKVLDLGCGGGLTGLTLQQEGKASEVIGVEISQEAARRAMGRMDQVIVGDLEQMEFPFPEDDFDFIILGDVLEHLIDPWQFLSRVKKYLKPTGRIIATMPNVRCWKVVYPLVFRGQWVYEEYGVLDKSHLRFFTKRTMLSLFRDAGLTVHKIVAMTGKNTISGHSRKTKTAFVDKITGGIIRDFLAPGYLMISGRRDL